MSGIPQDIYPLLGQVLKHSHSPSPFLNKFHTEITWLVSSWVVTIVIVLQLLLLLLLDYAFKI